MNRRFLLAAGALVLTVGFLIGLIVAGSMMPSRAHSEAEPSRMTTRSGSTVVAGAGAVSFADIAERLNPAVVNIDATVRGAARSRGNFGVPLPEGPDLDRFSDREREGPRRGAGAGFLIDAAGYILTNHHVVADADRITVRLTDGRSLRATLVGSDPDTDIALIKVESPRPLPFAALGNSDTLRVGEWVLAIGNPLAYEHTVTVGVVSFIGRKLFNSPLDRYIQTDAAINFGNSGGPLINARGEVIGINAAISSRASNIGFAVPINQASAILPQLRENGRVSRGYIGVRVRPVTPDLQRSLELPTGSGALVQDVTEGSPGARAGLRPYDLIVAVDGKPVEGDDQLVQLIAARRPGTSATLQVVRDGRSLNVPVKLAERSSEPRAQAAGEQSRPSSRRGSLLGLAVREMSREDRLRLNLEGVVVARVEPMGPAFDADIEAGDVILEINREPIHSYDDYHRMTNAVKAGDVLTFYLFKSDQTPRRELHTVRVE